MKFAKENYIILCDDVRQEVGNKISLMGIYGKDIIIPDIPYILPRLCIFLRAREVKIEIQDLKVVVKLPQSDPITMEIPAPPNQKIPHDMQIGMTIAPLNINGEGEAKIDIFQKDEPKKPLISHHFNLVKAK